MNRRGRPPHPDVLTPREWEVLALLREELTDQAIADRLGISLDGAKYHVREILSKLGVGSRYEAAAWQPEAPTPAPRWAVLPLAIRIAGVLVMVAAVAGLGLLAWGVVRTNDDGETNTQVLASPSPIHEGGPGQPVWERTGDFFDETLDASLSVLWLDLTSTATVEYAVRVAGGPPWEIGAVSLTDDRRTEYRLISNTRSTPVDGIQVGTAIFERPPDAGEELIFKFDSEGVGALTGPNALSVTFARNSDPDHGCCYTDGLRIAPEGFEEFGPGRDE